MASVFRRTKKSPLPDRATVVEKTISISSGARIRKGIVTWKDRQGMTREGVLCEEAGRVRVFTAEWLVGGAKRTAPVSVDGRSIMRLHGPYTIAWVDHTGKRRTKRTKTTDKAVAERIAAKLEGDAALRREGVIDVRLERFAEEAKKPLAEHIDDFFEDLRAKERTAKHIRMTRQHIEAVVFACGAQSIRDLSGADVMQAVGELREQGRSLRTCNAYLRAIKSFSHWLWKERRLPDHPLAVLRNFNEATDQRHVRRELTTQEQAILLTFVESYTVPTHNLAGPDRAMLYSLALRTGLRAGELRSLTVSSFDLSESPSVTVQAAYSKRRRTDTQPIDSDLAERLKVWLSGRSSHEKPFGKMAGNTARMLRSDLEAARTQWIRDARTDAERETREASDFLRYIDSAGRVCDFHSTRHTYISNVVGTGASVKTAQELARHSSPSLTIGRYAHTRLHDLRGAVEALAKPDTDPKATSESATLRATGTCDDSGGRSAWRSAHAASPCETVRARCETTASDTAQQKTPKSSDVADLSVNVQSLASPCEKRRRRDSNPRWRICNPLP